MARLNIWVVGIGLPLMFTVSLNAVHAMKQAPGPEELPETEIEIEQQELPETTIEPQVLSGQEIGTVPSDTVLPTSALPFNLKLWHGLNLKSFTPLLGDPCEEGKKELERIDGYIEAEKNKPPYSTLKAELAAENTACLDLKDKLHALSNKGDCNTQTLLDEVNDLIDQYQAQGDDAAVAILKSMLKISKEWVPYATKPGEIVHVPLIDCSNFADMIRLQVGGLNKCGFNELNKDFDLLQPWAYFKKWYSDVCDYTYKVCEELGGVLPKCPEEKCIQSK